MVRIFVCFALAFALLAPSAYGQQSTRLEAIVKRGTLRVAYWLQRDAALKGLVDNWIRQARDDGHFERIYAIWFE
jgi:hypothetical protein